MSERLREIETTFIVRAQRPEEIARRIADLRSAGSYLLVSRRTLTLYDRYFDTPDRRLHAAKLALRTRASGSATVLTLKGDPKPGAYGGQDRLEIEEPLSEESFLAIAGEMHRRSVSLTPQPGSGADIMQRAGLRIIQERKTVRQVRDVTDRRHRTRLAEMAVDFVQYRFPSRRICLHEIEIEARGAQEAEQKAMKAVSGALVKEFSSSLLPWPYSKLTTGNAIEQILSLEPAWDPGGGRDLLGPDAVDRVAATVRQGFG